MHEIGEILPTTKTVDGNCGDIVNINNELYKIIGFYGSGAGVYVKKDFKIYKVIQKKEEK